MTFIDPCPRFNPWCINKPTALPAGASWDYNIKNPIDPSSPVLCKSNTPWPSPVATWTAGQSVTIQFLQNNAAHGGGHAQFSVSYDGGKTFAVVYEVLKYFFFNGPSSSNTPEVLKYTFTLPKDLPSSDTVVFAWSWVNANGNREFYMNCADVVIKGTGSTSYTGKKMVIANHDGYPTIPEFSNNYDTGLQYYDTGDTVTVSGSGSTSGGSYSSGTNSGDSSSMSTGDFSSVNTGDSPSVNNGNSPDANAGKGNPNPTIVNIVTTTAVPLALISDELPDDEDGSDASSDSASVDQPDPNLDSDVASTAPPSTLTSESDSGGGDSGCTHGAMNCASGSSGYELHL
ncbi:hypothetical protein LPJ74_003787 [Coemansia sp. RSA 1843]|nr:hypothetical protein LPJ74_003787 [Coemansia sp. RSA 1843]